MKTYLNDLTPEQRERKINPKPARLVAGYNVKCSKCDKSFSSSVQFHQHVAQGCK